MSDTKPPAGFPETFGSDVTVRDINLDEGEFYVGGKRLTEARATELADRAERRAGRPSLTAPGTHSRTLNVRVPQETYDTLKASAAASNKRQSDIVREALEEYFERHSA